MLLELQNLYKHHSSVVILQTWVCFRGSTCFSMGFSSLSIGTDINVNKFFGLEPSRRCWLVQLTTCLPMATCMCDLGDSWLPTSVPLLTDWFCIFQGQLQHFALKSSSGRRLSTHSLQWCLLEGQDHSFWAAGGVVAGLVNQALPQSFHSTCPVEWSYYHSYIWKKKYRQLHNKLYVCIIVWLYI